MPTNFASTISFSGPASTRNRLSRTQQAQLRRMLEQQARFRTEQLADLTSPGVPGPLGAADREIRASLATGARAAMRDVRLALQRMDAGRYGLCTACHEPVGLGRLEILPQVALCTSCQRSTAPDDEAPTSR